MSDRIGPFLWLLSEHDGFDASGRSEPPPGDPLRLGDVRGEDVNGERAGGSEAERGRLARIQDLFAGPSDRDEEDIDVWWRMAVAVILAIAVGLLVALGAGIAFAHV